MNIYLNSLEDAVRDVLFTFAIAVSLCDFAQAQLASGGVVPTESEIKGIEALCGGGAISSVSAKASVDAAIKSWRDASVGVTATAAKSQLAGYLSKIEDDKSLPESMKLYLGCVKDSLQQFLNREQHTQAPTSSASMK